MPNSIQNLHIIRQFFGQENNLSVPKIAVRFFGDANYAMVFSQLLFWSDKTTRTDGNFYKSSKELSAELGLDARKIDRVITSLNAKYDFISYVNLKANGSQTRHFKISLDLFVEALGRMELPKTVFPNTENGISEIPKTVFPKQIRSRTDTKDPIYTSAISSKNEIEGVTPEFGSENKYPKQDAFNKFWEQMSLHKSNMIETRNQFIYMINKYHFDADQFATQLIEDTYNRKKIGQSGLANLTPVSYLKNERWRDDVRAPSPLKKGGVDLNEPSNGRVVKLANQMSHIFNHKK